MGTILDTQTRPILRSPFIDKRIVFRGPRIVFRGPSREQTTLFQPILLLTLAFVTPLTLLQVKTVMNGTCEPCSCFSWKDINLSDLQVDWLKWHDLGMANRTISIPYDLS